MCSGWRAVAHASTNVAAVLAVLAAPLAAQPAPASAPPAGGAPVARAVRVDEAPTIDGRLDEPFWSSIPPVTGFLQRDPVDGAEPSERTEARIAFDSENLYFALHLFDSEPARIRRSILHREGRIDQDDRVIIALDTYKDGRNAYIFELNSFGTQGDALISDETMTPEDWNWEGVYRSEARVADDGWTLEVAIPFTTIRFSEAEAPEMGVAFYRSIRRKNEDVYWPHIGQSYRAGISQVSRYATLTGLSDLRRGRHLEVKPFAIAGGQKIGEADASSVEDVGLDVKWALTSNMALDLTLNTDFAQVEADNVQVNLTRFSLFYPEKREFFLERARLFSFGATGETEAFFSRSIGIESDIVGGGRFTGQTGRWSVGALSLWTEEATLPSPDGTGELTVASANNSVVRVRADLAPRTTVGGIVTSLQTGDFHNRVAGADLSARFWSSSTFDVWAANVWDSRGMSSAAGVPVPDDARAWAGATNLLLRNARYTVGVGRTLIGEAYDPALGFVSRPDQKAWNGQALFTPRFESSAWARQLTLSLIGDHIEGWDGVKQSHVLMSYNRLAFQTGDGLGLVLRERFEHLPAPDAILGRELPSGDYTFRSVEGSVNTNESRTLSGNTRLSVGDFWSGTRTEWAGRFTWKTGPHLTLAGTWSWNDVTLPVADGEFRTTVLGLDVLGAVSRKLFANALVQYDDVSENLRANVRIDWIHTPGSDLFLVLDTGYRVGELLDPRDTRWVRRTGVVKVTYLKAF